MIKLIGQLISFSFEFTKKTQKKNDDRRYHKMCHKKSYGTDTDR